MRSLLAFLLPVGSDETGNTGSLKPRSGWLDAETLLIQTEMFLQPEAFRRFTHFYTTQITQNDRYGCHCQLKDLVSQDYIDYQDGNDHFKYYGQPVDALDRACHNHRECLRCSRMELGCASDGISEHYLDYSINKLGYCKDPVGSCERAYCECARQFIEDIHDNGIFRYTPKEYSRQYGFEPTESTCKRAVDRKTSNALTVRSDRPERRPIACCSSKGQNQSPWRLYNTDKFQCCSDGQVRQSC